MNLKFSPWYDLTETKEIQHRYAYAVSPRCTPVSVDKADKHAVFRGAHGIYRTSLSSCECQDFSKRGEPCKHILRLAMECGLIHANYESDPSKVPAVGSSDPGDTYLRAAVRFMESNPHGRGSVLELLARDQVYQSSAEIIEEPFLVHEYVENGYLLEDPEYYKTIPVKGILEEARLRQSLSIPQFTSDYQMRKWYREHIIEVAAVLEPDLQLLTFDDGSQKIVDMRMRRYILGEKLCICRGRVVQYWQIRMLDNKWKAHNPVVHELLMTYDSVYRSENTPKPSYTNSQTYNTVNRQSSPSTSSDDDLRFPFGILAALFVFFGVIGIAFNSLIWIPFFLLALIFLCCKITYTFSQDKQSSSVLSCPWCGSTIERSPSSQSTVKCEYCGGYSRIINNKLEKHKMN